MTHSHMPTDGEELASRLRPTNDNDSRNDSRNELLLSTSAEDLNQASPPYASTSTLNRQRKPDGLYANYPPSPAYRSQTSLKMQPVASPGDRDEKDRAVDFNDGASSNYHNKGPSVHYGEGVTTPGYHYDHTRPPSLAPTDDEGSDSDDYDWSDEGDLGEQEAKFEQRMGIKQKRKGWGFKRLVTALFSTLLGSTILAGVLVAPALLIHFYWYLKNPTDHRRYVKDNVQAWLFWAAANLLISWYLALIVDLIPIVARFLISSIWGHVTETNKSHIELFQSVKNTIKPLLYGACGWASWVIIFHNIFGLYNNDAGVVSYASYLDRVQQVVEFLFFLTLVICAQKMLSHAVAFNFHRVAFKERLEEVQAALSVIETLRDYRQKPIDRRSRGGGFRTPLFSGRTTPSAEKDSYFGSHVGHEDPDRTMVGTAGKGKGKDRSSWFSRTPSRSNTLDNLTMADHEMGIVNSHSPAVASGTATPHRYPPRNDGHDSDQEGGVGDNIVQAAKILKNAVLHDARNIKGKDDDGGLMNNLSGVGSSSEAKQLARTVFAKFRDRHSGRKYLIPSDLTPAFPDAESAEAAFKVFDKDNNGDLSRTEIKSLFVNTYKERRFLAKSMRDVGEALRTLDHCLLAVAMIVLFFISLSVFGVSVGSSLTSIYSIAIAASFIFQSTASRAFDAIMFLFVTHPYDTGDLCFIDEEILKVKKMTLFATIFARVDGTETYYFNAQLFTKFITNIRRSGKQFENCTIQIAWRTPLSKLDELEVCLNEWLSTEENRWFEPGTSIMLQKIEYQKYLELTIGMPHNSNWQDWGAKVTRKTAFHAAVNHYTKLLGIDGHEAPIPIVWGEGSALPDLASYAPQPPHEATATGEDTAGYDAGEEAEDEGEADDIVPETIKPIMGFVPPPVQRNNTIRARKTSRKKGMRGMDG